MYQPTAITWVLILFGLITCLPLLYAQLIILVDPKGQRAKDILIGPGEEWRDKSHFKVAYSLAVADWILFFPLLTLAIIGMLLGKSWGFMLFAISGAIQLYINTFLWFFEKEYVYSAVGPVKYFTIIWGNFMYWGWAATVYGILRVSHILI